MSDKARDMCTCACHQDGNPWCEACYGSNHQGNLRSGVETNEWKEIPEWLAQIANELGIIQSTIEHEMFISAAMKHAPRYSNEAVERLIETVKKSETALIVLSDVLRSANLAGATNALNLRGELKARRLAIIPSVDQYDRLEATLEAIRKERG